MGHVVIVVQNLPVPFDRRVWLECGALRRAGHEVSVICPRGPGDPRHHVVDGVHIHTYAPHRDHASAVAYLSEYAWSFAATAVLLARVRRRRGPIDVLQVCNPPDLFFPLAAPLRRRDGTRFVFDQHDLCPELLESRYPDRFRALHRALRWVERRTYAAADHVIATNESYKLVAMTRGAKRADEVTVVRTGPDPDRLRRRAADRSALRGRRHLVAYLGVMGPQDGVDLVVRAADIVVNRMGRHDIAFTLVGSGDSLPALKAEVARLGLDDVVHFTGRVPDDEVARVLSSASVGLSPDPKNPLNDVSTMNKTMEYMAFELPVVAFDLVETAVSAQDAAVYVTDGDIEGYAQAIVELCDDPERRRRMGAYGRDRVERHLAWHHQAAAYVGVYERLLAGGRSSGGVAPVIPLGGTPAGSERAAS
jgi:glycosyltransferase involved in cell wall biosynthesis